MLIIDALPTDDAPELVFGIVAPIGVDLDLVSSTLSEMLRRVNYKTHAFRLTRLMAEARINRPLEASTYIESYVQRIDYANEFRKQLGDDALAAMAISAIRAFRAQQQHGDEKSPIPGHAYIIRQLKRPEEVTLLRRVYGRQFVLISAYAPHRNTEVCH